MHTTLLASAKKYEGVEAMLIHSNRFRKGDLEHFQMLEKMDAIHVKTNGYKNRIKHAQAACFAFCEKQNYEGYHISISFGKDSVVMLHMMRQVDPLTVTTHVVAHEADNPEIEAVRIKLRELGLLEPYDERRYYKSQGKGRRFFDELKLLQKKYGKYVTGIRKDESADREWRHMAYGAETKNTFAPISLLTTEDIYAYIYEHDLPLCAVYAMSDGGRFDRRFIRLSSIGRPQGRGMGRREWEQLYFNDVLRKREIISLNRK